VALDEVLEGLADLVDGQSVVGVGLAAGDDDGRQERRRGVGVGVGVGLLFSCFSSVGVAHAGQ
jgi:hypothetical protein